jgi:hypothetical protein
VTGTPNTLTEAHEAFGRVFDLDEAQYAERRRQQQRTVTARATETIASYAQAEDLAYELDDDQAGELYAAAAALALREGKDSRYTDSAVEHLIQAMQTARDRYGFGLGASDDARRRLMRAAADLTADLARYL